FHTGSGRITGRCGTHSRSIGSVENVALYNPLIYQQCILYGNTLTIERGRGHPPLYRAVIPYSHPVGEETFAHLPLQERFPLVKIFSAERWGQQFKEVCGNMILKNDRAAHPRSPACSQLPDSPFCSSFCYLLAIYCVKTVGITELPSHLRISARLGNRGYGA